MTMQSPFVGLRTFETNDKDWFFGRDRETSALARKLQSASFTAVVGPSGSGKSSLVRAGVVPLLRAQGWTEVVAKPGSAPIARLAQAMALANPERHFAEAREFRFDTDLRASAFGLLGIIENLGVDSPRLLLVIDQFEELFRYGDDASGASKAGMREESRAFVELLLAAANGSNGRLHVCVTMRSDFFGACSSYAGLAEAISLSQYLVPIPVRHQLELAIRKPVEKAGGLIEEALVQRLLVDVEEEQDQLPLLQHTLRRLWEYASGEPRNMREEEYVTIGKIAGSIDRKAENVWRALGEANAVDLVTLERVMKALTDLDIRGRATRRMQKRSDLLPLLRPLFADRAAASASFDRIVRGRATLRMQKRSDLLPLLRPLFADTPAASASLDRVVGSLANEENSFLQLGEGKDPEVDIGHEALIRSWKRLSGPRGNFESGWLRDERDDGAMWRGYATRAIEGAFLSLQERLNVSNWLSRQALGEEWSQRYGDRWAEVKAFIARSWRRGIAWAAAGAMGVAALVVAGVWNANWIRTQIHEFKDIRPFARSQIFPLDTASEKALQPFSTFSECAAFSMCPEMVVIPPGKFTMGSGSERDNEKPQFSTSYECAAYSMCPEMGSGSGRDNEKPPRSVEISAPLAVAKYEVTIDQWMTCVDHGRCRDIDARRLGSANHPVVGITWYDAQTYVGWLSEMTGKTYRLPTEAEWEYIARAETTTPHYWDDDDNIGTDIAAGHANCAGCNNGPRIDDMGSLPVGSFPPNQFGVCDTLGNVWEFTADTYHPNYEGAPGDGRVWWMGPEPGHRIARGGSFSSNAPDVTASYRFRIKESDWYPGMGIRVARTLDARTLDARTLDARTLDAKPLDAKPLDAGPIEVKPVAGRIRSDRQNTCEQPK
jgi:formylglycine-generating enzyme required for sulfatase activity/energy-coupling factor transporter ATP-binding protein EcfA2